MATKYECGDFSLFQETLKKMREVDDKIIYALNSSIPTESFKGQLDATEQCKDLYDQINVAHKQRKDVINECIGITSDNVRHLQKKRDDDILDDANLHKDFKNEQRKLRLLKSELNVEDIVSERTHKAFHERCRSYFKGELWK